VTEPVPEDRPDVDAAIDELLTSILFYWGTDDIPTARDRLRLALLYSWYDGQSAAFNVTQKVGTPKQNPWTRSVK
jgi:hypothetical protein